MVKTKPLHFSLVILLLIPLQVYDSWILLFQLMLQRVQSEGRVSVLFLKKRKAWGKATKYILRGTKGMGARGSIRNIQGVGSSVSQALRALSTKQDNQVLLRWQPPSQKWCESLLLLCEILWNHMMESPAGRWDAVSYCHCLLSQLFNALS